MNNSILIKVLDLIDSGYWKTTQWQEWADKLLLKLDKAPYPYWLIQLSSTSSPEEATSILRESLAEINYMDNTNHKSVVLGYIFLRYLEKEIDLKNFLSLAWQETEAEENTGAPSNDEIFKMYEEYKNLHEIDDELKNLEKRVSAAFFDNTKLANKALLEVNSYISKVQP